MKLSGKWQTCAPIDRSFDTSMSDKCKALSAIWYDVEVVNSFANTDLTHYPIKSCKFYGNYWTFRSDSGIVHRVDCQSGFLSRCCYGFGVECYWNSYEFNINARGSTAIFNEKVVNFISVQNLESKHSSFQYSVQYSVHFIGSEPTPNIHQQFLPTL